MPRTEPPWTFTRGAPFTRNGVEALQAVAKSIMATENKMNSPLLMFVMMIASKDKLTAQYEVLAGMLQEYLPTVPTSAFDIAKAFTLLEQLTTVPIQYHVFTCTTEEITIAFTRDTAAPNSDDVTSVTDGPSDSVNESKTDLKVAPPVSVNGPNTDLKADLKNAKRAISDRTRECLTHIESKFKELHDCDEKDFLALRAKVETEKKQLLLLRDSLRKEFQEKKLALDGQLKELQEISKFYSESSEMKLNYDLLPH